MVIFTAEGEREFQDWQATQPAPEPSGGGGLDTSNQSGTAWNQAKQAYEDQWGNTSPDGVNWSNGYTSGQETPPLPAGGPTSIFSNDLSEPAPSPRPEPGNYQDPSQWGQYQFAPPPPQTPQQVFNDPNQVEQGRTVALNSQLPPELVAQRNAQPPGFAPVPFTSMDRGGLSTGAPGEASRYNAGNRSLLGNIVHAAASAPGVNYLTGNATNNYDMPSASSLASANADYLRGQISSPVPDAWLNKLPDNWYFPTRQAVGGLATPVGALTLGIGGAGGSAGFSASAIAKEIAAQAAGAGYGTVAQQGATALANKAGLPDWAVPIAGMGGAVLAGGGAYGAVKKGLPIAGRSLTSGALSGETGGGQLPFGRKPKVEPFPTAELPSGPDIVYQGRPGELTQPLAANGFVTSNRADAEAFARAASRLDPEGRPPVVYAYRAGEGALRPSETEGLAASRGAQQITDPGKLEIVGATGVAPVRGAPALEAPRPQEVGGVPTVEQFGPQAEAFRSSLSEPGQSALDQYIKEGGNRTAILSHLGEMDRNSGPMRDYLKSISPDGETVTAYRGNPVSKDPIQSWSLDSNVGQTYANWRSGGAKPPISAQIPIKDVVGAGSTWDREILVRGGPPAPPRPPTAPSLSGDVLPPVNQKLIQSMKDVTISAPERSALITAGRSRQAGAIASAIQGPGSFAERQAAAGARMSGQILPNMKPIVDRFTPEEIGALTAQIDAAHASGAISMFQWKTAGGAFTDLMTAGKQLQPAEKALLGKIFGPEFAAALPKNAREWSLWKEAIGIAGIPQTFSTAIDFSVLLRQEAMLGTSHPVLWAKTFPAMVKSARSEGGAAAIMDRLETLPFVKGTGELDGYGFRDVGGHLSSLDQFTEAGQMEPQYASLNNSFVSRMSQKIPGIRASERAFVVPINKLRGEVYNSEATRMWAAGVRDVQQFRALAATINHASGWGDFKVGQITDGVNAFFSPRNLTAKFQTVLDPFTQPGSLLKPSARQLAAKNLVAFAGYNTAILGLLKVTGLADVELDPRNSDFGKARFGNTRVDLMAGYSPMVRLVERLRTGEIKTGTGNIMPANRTTLVENFVRGKLGPLPATLVDTMVGKNAVGTPANDLKTPKGIRDQLYNILTPFLLQDVVEAAKQSGTKGALIAAPLSFLGGGVQSYQDSAVKQRQDALQADHSYDQYKIDPSQPASWSNLNVAGQNRWNAENGKLQSTSPESVASRERRASDRADLVATQAGVDTQFGAALTRPDNPLNAPTEPIVPKSPAAGQNWRDGYHVTIEQQDAQYKKESRDFPFTGDPSKDPTRQALAERGDLIDANKVGHTINWDAVDAWSAKNPDKQKLIDAYYADPNKPNTDLTPMVTAYKAASKTVGDSGFFDLRDQLWAQLNSQKAVPGYQSGQNFFDWKDALVEQTRQQMIASGMSPALAADQAQKAVDNKNPVVQRFNDLYKQQSLYPWMDAHRQEAMTAIQWGYITPDKTIDRFMAMMGGGK